MITYEERLNRDVRWAFEEGGLHFSRRNLVHQTLRSICSHLEELAVPYAVVGALAMFYHDYRRYTEDVNLLVTATGLQAIHESLDKLGWVSARADGRHLRDVETGVRIEFVVAGEYPGDRKPKPVAFPEPVGNTLRIDGYDILKLPKLIELKLASGMSHPLRLKDLGDVQEMLKTLYLPTEFGAFLDPSVRDKFQEFWQIMQDNPP